MHMTELSRSEEEKYFRRTRRVHYLSFQRAARVPSENLSVVVSKGVRGGEGGGGWNRRMQLWPMAREGFRPHPLRISEKDCQWRQIACARLPLTRIVW